MAKQCPLMIIVFYISHQQHQKTSFDCQESKCQMWDEKRKDCGLKQTTPQVETKPDFHPIDNPAQFPSEPE